MHARLRGSVRYRLRNVALQHQPQNAVVELIVHAIGRAEIQPLRHACGCGILRILFTQVLRGDDWVIRGRVGRRCEDVCQGPAEVIELREPPHAEDVLDRRDYVRRVDEAMHGARPVVGRDGVERRAVRIGVVGARLRVVLNDEDHRVLPIRTVRERLHDPPKSEVVVGHARARRALARPAGGQVVHRQPHDFKLWHVAVAHIALEFGDPHISALLVLRHQIHRDVVRIHVGAQVVLRHRPAGIPLDHFAVVAERDAVSGCERPQEPAFRLVALFAIHVGPLAGVAGGHHLLTVVRDVGGGGPDVSLRTDLGIHEEAIEQAEAPGQRVVVRSNGDVGEIEEARVAIAFLQVAQDLIVGAILFDDVDDVAEGRIAPRREALLPVIGGDDAFR
jgi:hypothetical protein